MKTPALVLAVAVSCIQISRAQTNRVVLTPIADSYLDEANPGSNFGTQRALFVGPQGDNKDLVTLVKFRITQGRIPGVPYRSTLVDAFFNFYLLDERGASPSAYLATSPEFSPKTENTVFWNGGWTGELEAAGSRAEGSPGSFRFNVLPIVESWYQGGTTHYNGFALAAPKDRGSTNNYNTFYSRESAHPPELVVLFDPPPPTWKPFDRSTMLVQAGWALGDATLGLLSANAAGHSTSIGGSFLLQTITVVSAVALPGVIWYFGEQSGGDGNLFWTLAGCAAGGAVGIVPGMVLSPDNTFLVAIVAAVFALGGGVFGYHYFASPVYELAPDETLGFNPIGPEKSSVVRVRANVISIKI
ncbi:MAG: DNRLRE domain-containing protein [Bacteroidota bacterium]